MRKNKIHYAVFFSSKGKGSKDNYHFYHSESPSKILYEIFTKTKSKTDTFTLFETVIKSGDVYKSVMTYDEICEYINYIKS